jgi:hypothetical protein
MKMSADSEKIEANLRKRFEEIFEQMKVDQRKPGKKTLDVRAKRSEANDR